MKKSRSSVPLFPDKCPPPAPPVKKVGLFATAGRPEPEPPAPPVGPLVAIAVGKTKEGESLPAKPSLEYPVPLYQVLVAMSKANSRSWSTDLSMTTAGVWLAMAGRKDVLRAQSPYGVTTRGYE
jgi:hypothetical protein